MTILYVEVDVACASFEGVAWSKRTPRQVERYDNTASGFRRFAERVEAVRQAEEANVIHLILEPTGGYQAELVLFAHRRGWRITQVNPLQHFLAVLQESFNNGAERRSILAIVRRRLSRYNNKRGRHKN